MSEESSAVMNAEAGSGTSGTSSSNSNMAWYIVHTYSGYENKAKLALEERIKSLKKESFFEEVLVPEENVVELVKGQKRTTKRRFFPGYILVKMILNDETWHIVKNTPKITGFVGDKVKPIPIAESEVQKMTNRIQEGQVKPRPRVSFKEGENVRVVEGPFSNFTGVVEAVNPDKGKVKVLVSIFGRSTPVELDFIQVEKI
jgi:transcriptional antiterminator NusG